MSSHACGCPGAHARIIEPVETVPAADAGRQQSELRQWPVQLHLVPPTAPYLHQAHLLIAADCVPFACPDFHRDYLKGRVLVNACPKLDDTAPYVDKLAAIIAGSDVRSVTVTVMEVPCCRGLAMMAEAAVRQSGRDVPLEVVVIGIDGRRRN